MTKKNLTKPINEESRKLATIFVEGIMNRNDKQSTKALEEMINNHISAKIRKVAQTEELI